MPIRVPLTALLVYVLVVTPGWAQLQLTTIHGQVLTPDGQPAAGARVVLLDRLGAAVASAQSSRDGAFALSGIAPGDYALRADAEELRSALTPVVMRGGASADVTLHLGAPGSEALEVTASEAAPDSRLSMAGETVGRLGGRLHGRALQSALATAPGWSTDDDGLLHYRGIDDGFLYVLDGVPVYERLDAKFGLAPDVSTIGSVQILSGFIPPEYGLRSAAVVDVRSVAPTDDRWGGSLDTSLGSETARALSVVGGGALGARSRVVVNASGERSSRFLDAVAPENFHNRGATSSGQAEYVWTGTRDALTLRGGGGRSSFDVPNNAEQQEAGQNARQSVDQAFFTAAWQRQWTPRTTSHVALYTRWSEGDLTPGPHDAPLSAEGDHSQRRWGALAAFEREQGAHTWKVGFEAAHLALSESFRFAVTDAAAGTEAGLSEGALAFTPAAPFDFQGRVGRAQFSAYLQDSWRVTRRLTVDVGVRYDHTDLLVAEQQLSPRAGVSFHFDDGTVLRAAVNRLYQPPQSEYLLLSSSTAARTLSPFADANGGGAELLAERQTALEVAVERPFGPLRAQLAVWRRAIRNQGDPNVFFGTTIIFPNSVARGSAEGLDVRVDLARRGHWSGYASYSLGRIVQFGPINGGLFLEDDTLAIGPGTRFVPDHDRRHVASANLTYDGDDRRLGATLSARYQSGVPVEVGADDLEALARRPGADLVDFATGRVRPAFTFDAMVTARVFRRGNTQLDARGAVFNLVDARYAFNFGNPFSGTHFGAPRTAAVGLRLAVR
jgi:outer membrane receptor protein involved in Fe transport